jgi:hypothetical protein
MRNRHRRAAFLPPVPGLLLFLILAQPCDARTIQARDPRAGVMDSSHVVIVTQLQKDNFQVEEVFLGEASVGDIVYLPNFRLFTYQQYGPDIVEPITPDTRILLFLKHKKDDPTAWEITAYGYCFFWVHNLDKVPELRKMATDAVALRRAWEAARDVPDEQLRVKALWPYLWNQDQVFCDHTKKELQKIGPAAGDYIASQFALLDKGQRMTLIRDIGLYGGEQLHQVMVDFLRARQEEFEKSLVQPGPKAELYKKYNREMPDLAVDIAGEIFYGLEGLASFKDSNDNPYIRELALWASQRHLEQACWAALRIFASIPGKENLPVIKAIWNAFPSDTNNLVRFATVMCLRTHKYLEAVPLLVKLLDSKDTRLSAHDILLKIAGKDLGDDPGAWMDWYKTRMSGT